MIFVRDLDRMAGFYSDTLGLKAIPETRVDGFVEFDAGGTRFALHAIPAEIAEGIEIASPPRPRETSAVKLTFSVEDLHAERKRLEGLGVMFIERPWGASEAVDPEGNVFGLE
jgi:catechol 2,3-dioxygenase-like lactoylglutathione lyase family enzyme